MRSKTEILLGALVLTAGIPGAALAQQSSGRDADSAADDMQDRPFDEIVVTAQKRSELLSDVPLSITAISGDQLLRQGVSSPDDLTKVVPGFSFQKSAFGVPVYSIRGIGFSDPALAGTPAVSVYIDQAPLPFSAMTRGAALDLERVEALKGPQGTLFGQNSTGGAINYIAAKPTTEVAAGFDLDYGRFNEINAQAFLSGSITPNLRSRIAVRMESRDDWQRGFELNDRLLGQGPVELGERRFYNGRYSLDWTPSSDVSLLFTASGWIDQSDTQAQQFGGFAPSTPRNAFNGATFAGYAGQVPVPRNSRIAGWNGDTDYGRDDSFYQLSLRGEVDLSEVASLTSISAYSRFRERSVTDVDGVAFRDQEVNLNADIESFFQELRLAIALERFDFTFGANYSTDETSEILISRQMATNNGFGPRRWSGVENRSFSDIETVAAFAGVDFHVTEQLTLQLSGRYTSQERAFAGCLADTGRGDLAAAFGFTFNIPTTPGNCVTTSAATGRLLPIVEVDLNEDNISWRGSINWKPSEDTLIYANLTRGYKAGSFPLLPAAVDTQFNPATQESVLAYEAGFKTSIFGRRMQLSGAVFYYDYTDKQNAGSISILGTTLRNLVNIPESRIYGAELETTIRPFDGLRLSGGVTYVNSRVQSDPVGPRDPFGRATTFIGEPFPNTPKWQASGDAEYRFGVGGDVEAFFGGSFSYRSATQPAFGESPELAIEGYTLVDLRAGIETDEGLRVQVWGKNVFNTYYRLNGLRQIDSISFYTGMPATYGITFGYRFR